MSYAKLRNSILQAREMRQALLEGLFPAPLPSVIMLSLNLPGEEKTGERAKRLFDWALARLEEAIPVQRHFTVCDALGPFALLQSPLAPQEAKVKAAALEDESAAGRLIDLDIYDASGRVLGRRELGWAPRACLLCPEDAVVCMRLKRHDSRQLQEKVHVIIDAL